MTRKLHLIGLSGVLALASAFAACSASNGGSGFDQDGEPEGDGGAGGHASSDNDDDDSFNPTEGGGGKPGSTCVTSEDVDDDLDGLSEAQGDCNDCDANVHPGSIEVLTDTESGGGGSGGGGPAEPSDEDCDGMIDNVAETCDDAIDLADPDAMNGARAVDLCQLADDVKWGVVSANYVRANGTVMTASNQMGILETFGPNVAVQAGTRMLGLSSGRARLPEHPDNCGTLSCSGTGAGMAPPYFPQDVPGCSGSTDINDDVGLEVKVKSPKNATGYSFLFKFYSFEYPEWVCTSFNDQFIALVSPEPMGSINGNVSFDSMNNPVSVNVAFFDVCAGCPAGTGEMQSTGFDTWDDAGGTSWLKTTAPVTGGDEITLRWAIWDTGDSAWDSTVLVDGFEWIATGGTPAIGTEPIPDPK
jgi:hypothetical protein